MRTAAVVVIAIVAAVAAVANWWSRIDDRRAVELISKPTATIAIGILALLVADDVPGGALAAAVVGFICCLAGDIALLPAIDRFVVGLASFLVGHLAFVVMFVILGLDGLWLGGLAFVGVVLLITIVGRPILNGAAKRDPAMVVPVRAYLAIISSMAVVGWSTGRPAAIVGSTLFVISDSILGRRQFVDERPWMPVAIMMTYHGALLGLALSLAG